MLMKKCIGATLACALALCAWSGTALATPVNIGGVMFDTDSPLDLKIQALNYRETSLANPPNAGDTVMGYGQIGSINGKLDSEFCGSNCDLTFTFEFTFGSIDPTASNMLVFSAGTINFYVGADGSFNELDPTTAGVGPLWLSLSGHAAPQLPFTNLGVVYSTVQGPIGAPTAGSTGFGLFDVTGGMAASHTDTNTVDDGIGGWADFSLASSFYTDPAGICTGNTCYPITGTGTLLGDSVVPEPGALGLLGLGLVMTGFFIRRRRREA